MKSAVPKLVVLLLSAPVWSMEPGAVAPATPPVTTAAAKPVAAPAASAAAPVGVARRAEDRLELDATQITGNRELPRVLYVVPWKRSNLGDMGGRPANSLLDEVLAPVDRDVFRRQNRYYDALKPDSSGLGKAVGAEVEK